MNKYWNTFKNKFYSKIIQPIIESISPVNEVAWGFAIGVFIGFTPTVGIQMYSIFVAWLFCRPFLKFRFDLVVGASLVWISNPLTMGPLYYGFLAAGQYVISLWQPDLEWITYHSFATKINLILGNSNFDKLDLIVESTKYMWFDIGIPMILGSMFYAIPFAISSFFIVKYFLSKSRKRKALNEGISYDAWRLKYEKVS